MDVKNNSLPRRRTSGGSRRGVAPLRAGSAACGGLAVLAALASCGPGYTGPLTACNCMDLHMVNDTNPVCGCHNPAAGSIGSGVELATMGVNARYSSGMVDAANNRLVLASHSDSGSALWAVDLATGNRSVISGTVSSPSTGTMTVGSGPMMGPIGGVRAGSDGWYVLELAAGMSDQIQRVDPATGNRTTVLGPDSFAAGAIDCGSMYISAHDVFAIAGLAIAPDNTVYIVGDVGSMQGSYIGVLALTLGATPSCRVVSATAAQPMTTLPEVGTGPRFFELDSIDYANGALWAYDSMDQSIFRIDPMTGTRTIVSSNNPDHMVGTGTCWLSGDGGSSSLALGDGFAWAASDNLNIVTRVDLATGNTTCNGGMFAQLTIDTSAGVWIHPTMPLVLAAGGTTVWVIDPAGGVANILSN